MPRLGDADRQQLLNAQVHGDWFRCYELLASCSRPCIPCMQLQWLTMLIGYLLRKMLDAGRISSQGGE